MNLDESSINLDMTRAAGTVSDEGWVDYAD